MSARSAKQRRRRISARVIYVAITAFGLLCIFAAIALVKDQGVPLLRDARLPVRHVELVGELRHLDDARAQRLLGPALGSNLIAVDVATLKRRLESHPWVERAVIVRVWPDRLRVTLIERKPVARWGQSDFIDVSGKRFEPDGESRPELPMIHGPDGLEQSLVIALASSREQLSALGLRLESLILDERRAWTIRLENGLELRLGRQQFARRLDRFADAYVPFLASRMNELVAVDLRYTNGFALSWQLGASDGSELVDDGSAADGQEG